MDQSAASLRSPSVSHCPKCVKNPLGFLPRPSWRRRNFLGKHFCIPGICGGAAAKARLLCSVFLYAAVGATTFLTGAGSRIGDSQRLNFCWSDTELSQEEPGIDSWISPWGKKGLFPLSRTSYEEKGRVLMWVDTGDLCRPTATASWSNK